MSYLRALQLCAQGSAALPAMLHSGSARQFAASAATLAGLVRSSVSGSASISSGSGGAAPQAVPCAPACAPQPAGQLQQRRWHVLPRDAGHPLGTQDGHAGGAQEPVSSAADRSRVLSDGSTLCYEPESTQTSTLLWLHGLGESGAHWADVAVDILCPSLPHTRVLLPTAPRRAVSLLNGAVVPAWMDRHGHADCFHERCEGLEVSVAKVEALLDEEVASGTPASRIVLGGFSQGAALALHTVLRTKHTLAGVLVVAGYLPGLYRMPMLVRGRLSLPLLFCHGSNDDVVHIEDGWRSFSVLYSGSMEECDSTTARHLREMWTFQGGTRPVWDSTGVHPPYQEPSRPSRRRGDDSDDEFESLRSRMSMGADRHWRALPRPNHLGSPALSGPACVLPGGGAAENRAARLHCSLTSFVTFPGLGHMMNDETLAVGIEWMQGLLGPDDCPHPPLRREDPFHWARRSSL